MVCALAQRTVYKAEGLHYSCLKTCSGNAKSQLKPVIEDLVGRQGQTRELRCSNAWECLEGVQPGGATPSQTSFKIPHERKILFFVSMSMAATFGHILICCSLGFCYSAIITVLSITLQSYDGPSGFLVDCMLCYL